MTILRMYVVVVSSYIRKKYIMVVRFYDHLGTAVWPLLKDYLLKQDTSAADDMHFMCNYCKPGTKCQRGVC